MQVKLSPWETVGFSLGSLAMFVFYWVDTYLKVKGGEVWVAEVGDAPVANEGLVEAFTEITGMVTPSECVWLVPDTLDVNA